jgi:uncharacterized membrane protein
MSRILAVAFDNETKAYAGTAALTELEREGSISLFVEAVVVKHADGTATIKHGDDEAPVGALTGAAGRGLLGLLGGPTGVAIGSMPGVSLGGLPDLDDERAGREFVDETVQLLTPNKVAVIAEIEEDWTTPVDTIIEALGGVIVRASATAAPGEDPQPGGRVHHT